MDSMELASEEQAEVSGAGFKSRKRSRTAVACRRCKTRKQKCDGANPKCSNCANSDSTCEYDFSPTLNRNQEQYLRARRRVEELEGALGRLTRTSVDANHEPALTGHILPVQSTESNRECELVPMRNVSLSATSSQPPVDHPHSPQSVLGLPDHTQPPPQVLPRPNSPSEPTRAFQNLAFQATGGFVGSSDDTFERVLHAVVSRKKSLDQSTQPRLLDQNLTPKSLENAVQPGSSENITLAGIPDIIADRMINKGYLHYIAVLWPVMQPKQLQKLHRNRAQLTDRFEVAALHLVYAAAGRFLETTGETGSFRSENHYRSAMALLGEILALSASVQTIQILLLLAMYGLRAPRGPGAWPLVGIAMRMCIELGMHRKSINAPGGDAETEDHLRCVFWSCYCLDRQTSIILGRPFALADQDIDAELPLGIDDESRRSLIPFTHICRLRIIESRIQQTVYRVDKVIDPATMTAEIEASLRKLQAWKSTIPMQGDQGASSIHSRDSYLIYYHQAVRFLLQPRLLAGTAEDKFLLLAVKSCGGICQTYKRLHQSVSVGFSLMALHSVFFAGVTILYCAWDSPALVLTNATRNMINDCSIVLYIITERWPGAKRYRDLFEAIKEPLLDTIEQSQGARRAAVQGLQPEVHNALHSMEQPEFSAMLMKMTGESQAADNVAHQHKNNSHGHSTMNESSYDLGVMPELAFDFSLPFDSCDPSYFDPPYSDANMRAWCQNVGSSEAFAGNDLSA